MKFPIKKQEKLTQRITGLGDIIAVAADPIKQFIIKNAPDKVAEWMKNCNCNQRKEFLNNKFPVSLG